jgi:hypothetical protein
MAAGLARAFHIMRASTPYPEPLDRTSNVLTRFILIGLQHRLRSDLSFEPARFCRFVTMPDRSVPAGSPAPLPLAPSTTQNKASMDSAGLKSKISASSDRLEKESKLCHDVESGADNENAVAEKRYLRRLDWIILPAISTLYFFEYLDRGNVAVRTLLKTVPLICGILAPGLLAVMHSSITDPSASQNAKLYGFDKGNDTAAHGLGPGMTALSSSQWQLVVMIFYVGLVLFQVPGCIGYRVFPPSRVSTSLSLIDKLLLQPQSADAIAVTQWIAFGVCGWAIVSQLQTVTYNLAGELACRIFIGVFEGLFGTGVVYYLSLWYHRSELGTRVFWFLGPTAVAGCVDYSHYSQAG